MLTPLCGVCGFRHWDSEAHKLSRCEEKVLAEPSTERKVTKRGFGSGKGRPKKYETEAIRRRARGRQALYTSRWKDRRRKVTQETLFSEYSKARAVAKNLTRVQE